MIELCYNFTKQKKRIKMQKTIDKEEYLIGALTSSYIGDDGAVVGETIYSMDAFFEDVHFKRKWMSMRQIARKAMLVNLSDAIAMNAQPQFALVTLSIPQNLTLENIDELRESLEEIAKEYGCEIIGGDTVGGDKLHLSITIISQSKYPLLRKGLKEGDFLAFTGELGESKRDLDNLFKGEKIALNSKFYEPILRAEFIKKARKYLRVGMDISDGLFCDTNKLLNMNGLGYESIITIEEEIGLSGEEYEMLVGFSSENYNEVLKVAKETKTPLTVFAKIALNTKRFVCHSHHF